MNKSTTSVEPGDITTTGSVILKGSKQDTISQLPTQTGDNPAKVEGSAENSITKAKTIS